MKKSLLPLIRGSLSALILVAQSSQGAALPKDPSEQLLSEQKHFAESLAYVYSPPLWISYHDSLYLYPKDDDQDQQLESRRMARSRYVAFTNRETQHGLAAKVIAESGIAESWQKKILLPYSVTNQNLTPVLARILRIVGPFQVLQSLGDGDALLQEEKETYFVMGFGRGVEDAYHTNAFLVREGWKSYLNESGETQRVDAFTNVSLDQEETAVLRKVAAAFRKKVASLEQEIASLKAPQEEFEACKARANDSSPHLQYQVAKAYLEGKGTDKDEKLGLEWMRRAAKNGSGEAQNYLEKLKGKQP